MIPFIPSYPHTRHWPKSMSVHRDDHYHSDPGFFVQRDVVITEKLDGGLTWIHGGKVYARSSGQPAVQGWFDYVKSRTVPKLHSVWQGITNEANPHLCVVGEDLYGIHSIEYDHLPDSFFMFHLLDRDHIDSEDTSEDFFWWWDDVVKFANTWELQTVPVMFEGKFKSQKEITDWLMNEIRLPSAFGPTREGFVIRVREEFPFDEFEQHVAKFVRPDHVQTDQHWTRNWKPAKIAG